MEMSEIHGLLATKEYSFLRTNEHLGSRIMFLTLGGSYAYGTNVKTSDVDIRGCALNSPSDLIGLSNFEQVTDEKTDTVVYGFNKLIQLLLNCNPNTIELLGCKPEHYLLMTDLGRELIANRKLFLSKRAVRSFSGYATQQLRRLENALAREPPGQAEREEHIRKSLEVAVSSFEQRYEAFDQGSIRLSCGPSEREGMESEVLAEINLHRFPVREFTTILNELSGIVSTYEKLSGRNRKKDAEHLNKHAMHLVRLYLMCIDILEKEEIITYRADDRELLMGIRSGSYMAEDGTIRKEFWQLIDKLEQRMQYAAAHTSLPEHPDMEKVEEFVMDVNRRALDGEA